MRSGVEPLRDQRAIGEPVPGVAHPFEGRLGRGVGGEVAPLLGVDGQVEEIIATVFGPAQALP